MDTQKVMDYLKKVWGQMDRRSLMTIIIVGAIALAYIFPKAPVPVDLTDQLASANQSIASLNTQLTQLQTAITNDQSRLQALESKPDRLTELQSALASVEGSTAKVALLEAEVNNLKAQISGIQPGGGSTTDLTTITMILSRLDAVEAEVDALQAGGGGSSNTTTYDYSITATFNTNCQWHPVYGTTWYGQQFKLSSWAMEVNTVRLFLKRQGNGTNAVITIYNLNTSGHPTGTAVWTSTVDTSTWLTTGQWIGIPVSGVTLNANGLYAVIVASPNGNSSNNVMFGYQDVGSYPDGGLIGTLTGGQVWTVSPAPDMGFEIRGIKQ